MLRVLSKSHVRHIFCSMLVRVGLAMLLTFYAIPPLMRRGSSYRNLVLEVGSDEDLATPS